MRGIVHLAALLLALLHGGAAWAHASLVRAEPADGAIVAEAPAALRLTFNEPVVPLVMRLIAPDGTATTPAAAAQNTTVTVTTPALRRGTHVLSWRVTSADGHPVGGSLVFSVGEVTAQPATAAVSAVNPVRAAIWAAKLCLYAAIFIGIGGIFFRNWMGEGFPRWLDRVLLGLVAAGLVVAPLSVGLQGLDALDLTLPELTKPIVWDVGFDTSYGVTALVIAIAMVAALASVVLPCAAGRLSAVAAMALAGLALALSGHASNAAPQLLTRPSVFVHVVCVGFWIGALLPILASISTTSLGNGRGGGLLDRFSRAIPYPLAALVVSGVILAVVQLDRIDALWTTSYGTVLSCKIAAVAALLGLGALNRTILVPQQRPLAFSVRTEICIAVTILALVATWRFTPPPRALAAAEPFEIHVHGIRAMAHLSLTPVRARDPHVYIEVFDDSLNLLPVKEVTISLAKPDAGIEPVRRPAVHVEGVRWRVDGLRVPVAGRWTVRVDLLVGDFEKISLEEQAELPRLP